MKLMLPMVVLSATVGIGQVTTATFSGTVTDPSVSAIPEATVTLTNEGTGAKLTKASNERGEFAFDFLPIGSYTLTIEAKGFKRYENRGLDFTAGQNVRQTFPMQIGTVSDTVLVEATTPLVDSVSSEQRETRSELEISQLPVARRNYSSLLAIGTGVSYTGDAGNGVRLNGLGKSGTNITVDGTDASSNPEGRATSMYQGFNYIDTLSIEGIQEVQVIKGIVPAEYGQTLGGNVNLITKSGTNTYHGSLFENFQAENLNARNQFLATRPPLTFNQYGGSLSGPIKRDRIFVFGAYEGYQERAFRLVSGNTMTQSFRDEVLRAVPAYARAIETLPLPNQPGTNPDVGFFLSASKSPASDNHAVLKGDIRVTEASNLALTYTRGRPVRLNPTYRIGNDRQWLGFQERGTASYVFGASTWTSETRFGYNLNEMNREDLFWSGGLDTTAPESQVGGRRIPAIEYPGFSSADSEIIYIGGPVWTLEQKVAKHLGAHSFKFGGKYGNRGGGRANIENPRVRYDTRQDFLANRPSRIQATFGVNPYKSTSKEFGLFMQDDWRVSPTLVVNLGLRYDYFGKFVAEPTTDAPAGLYNLNGLLDNRFTFGPFRDPKDPFENDGWTNFGPRLGFAWNVDGRSNTVVRGGFGVMFSPLMWGTFNNAVASSQTLPFRVNLARAEVERFNLRFPAFNETLRPLVEGSGQVQVADIFKPDIEAPYSMNLYLGVQRSLSNSLMLETAFVGNRGVKFFMYRAFNPVDRVTGVRPNPNLGQGNYLDDSQNTLHYSWQTSLRKRYSSGVTGSAHYTWGRSLSYTGGDIGASFQGDATTVVQDFFNWRAERGPSAGDVRHYFASDIVWDIPFLRTAANAVVRSLFGGWQLAGILRAQTGDAFTLTQPSAIPSSRPDYVGGNPVLDNYRDTLIYLNTAAFARVPISPVSRATIRPGNIGNGALRGPGQWNTDLSFGKNFKFTEKTNLQIRADAFNALNHTNLGNPNTNIESPLFGRITGARGARVIQLNSRFSF